MTSKSTAKLDRETEELHHQRLPLEVGKLIQKGRQEKGLTQKELATKICEKQQVIAEHENGKAIPNHQLLSKIEKAIGESTELSRGHLILCENSVTQQALIQLFLNLIKELGLALGTDYKYLEDFVLVNDLVKKFTNSVCM
ncbi:endothelial differentiation-related factor 1 homolog isoform X1 [Latimeria chalumnae]|uniref:endothelial differentiation-related factor 1 homolog isoform X1 n=1 Tax=Latimeria chalumnae TaxID=7897 RepID=UPI00313C4CE9